MARQPRKKREYRSTSGISITDRFPGIGVGATPAFLVAQKETSGERNQK
jgi:hypothetical protein